MGKKVTGVERVAAQSHPSQLSPAAWKINKHTRTNRRTENKKTYVSVTPNDPGEYGTHATA